MSNGYKYSWAAYPSFDLSQGLICEYQAAAADGGPNAPDSSDASYPWSVGSIHKTRHGSVLSISNVSTYPPEDACIFLAEETRFRSIRPLSADAAWCSIFLYL